MMRNTNLNEDMIVAGHGFELRSEGQLAIEGYLQFRDSDVAIGSENSPSLNWNIIDCYVILLIVAHGTG